MIISHRYKYLFIELPRSGTTATGKELQKLYDGVPILAKHSTYFDFKKIASDEELKYFVFSGIRNPMDDAVSRYFKIKSNHSARHTNPKSLKRRWTMVEKYEDRLFRFVQETDADFPTFFKKAYIFPYSSWATMNHKDFDFIIRFENLRKDFEKALIMLGIEQERPLPQLNKTNMRKRNYLSYYKPETRAKAKRIFGPFMKEWGYEFPPEWGEGSVPMWNQMEYRWVATIKNVYWRYLRYRI